METGQSSRSNDDGDDVWAKLVPNDSRYDTVEIRSQDSVVCSETMESSPEKISWCEISWSPDHESARIRNLSSNAIILDGTVVGEEAVDIKSGSEIISGPDKKGYLTYNFQVIPAQNRNVDEKKKLKISLDVEHAKCCICLNIWHDVVTVAPCLHNFCNGCFSQWLRRSSTRSHDPQKSVVCPQCRSIVHSVGRNHFLHTIEEDILQTFSSLKRSDEEIAQLDSYASIKPNLVLGMKKKVSRKRPSPISSDESSDVELPCPQCDAEIGGFKCNRATTHLQCQGCGGFMPSRPDIGVPQHCLGCDRAFCGAYWVSQRVVARQIDIVCNQQTFTPILEHTISRIPDSTHQSNQFEKDVTDRCIQKTGKTLQAVISDWIIKFHNRDIDRSRLQLNHAETIDSRTHLCNDCYNKFVDFLLYWFRISMPRSLLPPEASTREDCWYGYACRTQHHSYDHARKRNHVCRPTRGAPNF